MLIIAFATASGRRLVENHADARWLSPDHATVTDGGFLFLNQIELLGNADRAADAECRAGLGQIADGAIDRTAAKLDHRSFQNAQPGRHAVVVIHDGPIFSSAP